MAGRPEYLKSPGPQPLTAEQAARARELYVAGEPLTLIAADVGIGIWRFLRWMKQQDLPRRGQGRGSARRNIADPTPEEIRARAAECRQRWTPDRWGITEPDTAELLRRLGRAADEVPTRF